MHKESKIFLLSIDTRGVIVIELISECLTEMQLKAMRKCMRGKVNECIIQWLSKSTSFRYVIHGELAKGRIMV